MTGISRDILARTVEAFGSIISNKLNRVVKLLTSMTIIFTVPMLVADIYGMNVKLPFQDFERGFWVVMGIMAIVTRLGCTSSGNGIGSKLQSGRSAATPRILSPAPRCFPRESCRRAR